MIGCFVVLVIGMANVRLSEANQEKDILDTLSLLYLDFWSLSSVKVSEETELWLFYRTQIVRLGGCHRISVCKSAIRLTLSSVLHVIVESLHSFGQTASSACLYLQQPLAQHPFITEDETEGQGWRQRFTEWHWYCVFILIENFQKFWGNLDLVLVMGGTKMYLIFNP